MSIVPASSHFSDPDVLFASADVIRQRVEHVYPAQQKVLPALPVKTAEGKPRIAATGNGPFSMTVVVPLLGVSAPTGTIGADKIKYDRTPDTHLSIGLTTDPSYAERVNNDIVLLRDTIRRLHRQTIETGVISGDKQMAFDANMKHDFPMITYDFESPLTPEQEFNMVVRARAYPVSELTPGQLKRGERTDPWVANLYSSPEMDPAQKMKAYLQSLESQNKCFKPVTPTGPDNKFLTDEQHKAIGPEHVAIAEVRISFWYSMDRTTVLRVVYNGVRLVGIVQEAKVNNSLLMLPCEISKRARDDEEPTERKLARVEADSENQDDEDELE